MTNEQKPIILQIEEGKQELVQCVNHILQGGLNCYLIEPMFAELYAQIKASARNELEQARMQVAAEQNMMVETQAIEQNMVQAEDGAE